MTNIDGLVWLHNTAGLALAARERQVAELEAEIERLNARVAELEAQSPDKAAP